MLIGMVAGAPVHLRILGEAHPPVAVEVGEAPADPTPTP